MKLKITALLCACLLLVTAGCSLAKADQGSDPSADRLVGAFVSTQPLDVPMSFQNGSLVSNGVLEAQRSVSADGTAQYRFDGVEGVMLYNIPVTEGEARSFRSAEDDRVIQQNTGFSCLLLPPASALQLINLASSYPAGFLQKSYPNHCATALFSLHIPDAATRG